MGVRNEDERLKAYLTKKANRENLDLQESSLKPKVGRPKTGKRSNPAYTQISAYISIELRLKTEALLLKKRTEENQISGLNLSDLIEELLTEWVNGQD
jgi:hypothetical protein